MQKKAISVLGISPGTRSMGIAIFRNNELAEWKIRTIKNENGKGKGKIEKTIAVLERLIDDYEITKVAIKSPHLVSSSIQLNNLVSQIQQMLKLKRVRLYCYSLPKMKQSFSNQKGITNAELFMLVRNQFCIDTKKLIREDSKHNLYYGKMYEAIVCAKVLLDKAQLKK